jgi:hypothetical protein
MGVSFLGNGGGRVVVICCDSEVGAVRGVADGIARVGGDCTLGGDECCEGPKAGKDLVALSIGNECDEETDLGLRSGSFPLGNGAGGEGSASFLRRAKARFSLPPATVAAKPFGEDGVDGAFDEVEGTGGGTEAEDLLWLEPICRVRGREVVRGASAEAPACCRWSTGEEEVVKEGDWPISELGYKAAGCEPLEG